MRPFPFKSSPAIPAIFALFLGTLTLLGCGVSAPERLEVTSLGDTPRTLAPELGLGTYSLESANTSFILSDISHEQLIDSSELFGHVLHVELLWVPTAGKTAVEPAATNTSIRLLVFSGRELGLYGGGGFAWPSGDPGSPAYGIDIVGSNISLLAATAGFIDLLSPAQLTGQVRTRLDGAATKQMTTAASQFLTNALKRAQWVGPRSRELQQGAALNGEYSTLTDFVVR
ncbi:MAG: hypothetical protein EXS01_04215 [Phycisphaerales bacterium]|nr:hypothetical protein [Phycisphaerales bacterium]